MIDDRAVTPAVTHALTIGISTILITGLLLGAGQLLDEQRTYVVEQGLENVGSAVTSDLVRMDQFNTSGLDSDLAVTTRHPEQIGGRTYDVVLDPGPRETTLFLNATDESQLNVRYRFDNRTAVCPSSADGGAITVAYDASASCLTLREER